MLRAERYGASTLTGPLKLDWEIVEKVSFAAFSASPVAAWSLKGLRFMIFSLAPSLFAPAGIAIEPGAAVPLTKSYSTGMVGAVCGLVVPGRGLLARCRQPQPHLRDLDAVARWL